jgi:hypothetical protein
MNDLDTLIQDGYMHLMSDLELVSNPNTPIDVLTKLARNLRTPSGILSKLAESEEWFVRSVIAGNPSTPAETLTKLSNDVDWFVKIGVANNPYCPVKTLTKLAQDGQNVVHLRQAIVNNPGCPDWIRVMMS